MTWKWILFSDWYIHDIFVGTHADYTYGNTSSKGIVSWDDQTPSTSCLLTYIIVILMHNWTQCYLVLSHGCLSFACPLISFFIWSTSLLDMQWPNMFNRATVWEDQVRLFTVVNTKGSTGVCFTVLDHPWLTAYIIPWPIDRTCYAIHLHILCWSSSIDTWYSWIIS